MLRTWHHPSPRQTRLWRAICKLLRLQSLCRALHGWQPHLVKAFSSFPFPINRTDIHSFRGLVQQFQAFSPYLTEMSSPMAISHCCRPSQRSSGKPHSRKPTHWWFGSWPPHGTSPTTLQVFPCDWELMPRSPSAWAWPSGRSSLRVNGESSNVVPRHDTPAESRYSTTDVEPLAFVWAVRKPHLYLAGADFELVIDPRSLIPILNSKAVDELPFPRLVHLKENLALHHFKAVWRRGIDHKVVDCFSRCPVDDSDAVDEEADLQTTANTHAMLLQAHQATLRVTRSSSSWRTLTWRGSRRKPTGTFTTDSSGNRLSTGFPAEGCPLWTACIPPGAGSHSQTSSAGDVLAVNHQRHSQRGSQLRRGCGTPSVPSSRASPYHPPAIPPLRADRSRFISARWKAVSRHHQSILRLAYRRYLRPYGYISAGDQPSEKVDGWQGHPAADYRQRSPRLPCGRSSSFATAGESITWSAVPTTIKPTALQRLQLKQSRPFCPKTRRMATSTSMQSAPVSWSSEVRCAPTVSALPNCCSAGLFDCRCQHILAHSSRSGATSATPLTRQPPLLGQKPGNGTTNTWSLFQFWHMALWCGFSTRDPSAVAAATAWRQRVAACFGAIAISCDCSTHMDLTLTFTFLALFISLSSSSSAGQFHSHTLRSVECVRMTATLNIMAADPRHAVLLRVRHLPFQAKRCVWRVEGQGIRHNTWRDRDPNDIVAHCSFFFCYPDYKFSNFVCPSELHPFFFFFFFTLIWFLLKIPSAKRKIAAKPSKTPKLLASS